MNSRNNYTYELMNDVLSFIDKYTLITGANFDSLLVCDNNERSKALL